MHGHIWTLLPAIGDMAFAPAAPSQPWQAQTIDPTLGPVQLTGHYQPVPRARGIVVLLHGLAGSAQRGYMVRAANAATQAGLSSLRVNLRGADGTGEDFYHAGLTDDVLTAVSSAEVKVHEHCFVLGFSLGGHIALRFASSSVAANHVTRAAALCAPLDLEASCRHIDSRRAALYRAYLLRGLRRHYAEFSRRRGALQPAQVENVRSIRQWDEQVIAPRFGFSSAQEYYRSQSVAPRLSELKVPTLLVSTRRDPMVHAATVAPVLRQAESAQLTTEWLDRGGHVGFPPRTDPVPRMLAWLAKTTS